jgi:hypothetical protein
MAVLPWRAKGEPILVAKLQDFGRSAGLGKEDIEGDDVRMQRSAGALDSPQAIRPDVRAGSR